MSGSMWTTDLIMYYTYGDDGDGLRIKNTVLPPLFILWVS